MCKALQRSQPDKLVNWQHSVAGGGGGGGNQATWQTVNYPGNYLELCRPSWKITASKVKHMPDEIDENGF